MSTVTYGVMISTGMSYTIREYGSLADARQAYADEVSAPGDGVDVIELVELEGSGPFRASDGTEIAPTHAPRKVLESKAIASWDSWLESVTDEQLAREVTAAGSVEQYMADCAHNQHPGYVYDAGEGREYLERRLAKIEAERYE